jgi:phage tail tape-measure protein
LENVKLRNISSAVSNLPSGLVMSARIKKNPPDSADQVAQAAGGISGVVAGAAIGSSAGPIGTLLGGIAGAIGGWWSGRALAEAVEDISEADDEFYRADFASRDAQRAYEECRAVYYLGDLAAANPNYAARGFEEVEPELSRGWQQATADKTEWEAVRSYASVGFYRGKERRRTPR